MGVLEQLNTAIEQIQANLPFLLKLVSIAWCVHIVNMSVGGKLSIFGVLPRTVPGILGIFVSPFLHGSLNHLFMNSLFFLGLGSFVLIQGKDVFVIVSASIIVISGLGVWLFGRKALHIGASGLIMGYWSYILVDAYYFPNIVNLFAAAVGMYYFGMHMAASLLASGKNVSMEGHAFGFIAGGITAAFYPFISSLLFPLFF